MVIKQPTHLKLSFVFLIICWAFIKSKVTTRTLLTINMKQAFHSFITKQLVITASFTSSSTTITLHICQFCYEHLIAIAFKHFVHRTFIWYTSYEDRFICFQYDLLRVFPTHSLSKTQMFPRFRSISVINYRGIKRAGRIISQLLNFKGWRAELISFFLFST